MEELRSEEVVCVPKVVPGLLGVTERGCTQQAARMAPMGPRERVWTSRFPESRPVFQEQSGFKNQGFSFCKHRLSVSLPLQAEQLSVTVLGTSISVQCQRRFPAGIFEKVRSD